MDVSNEQKKQTRVTKTKTTSKHDIKIDTKMDTKIDTNNEQVCDTEKVSNKNSRTIRKKTKEQENNTIQIPVNVSIQTKGKTKTKSKSKGGRPKGGKLSRVVKQDNESDEPIEIEKNRIVSPECDTSSTDSPQHETTGAEKCKSPVVKFKEDGTYDFPLSKLLSEYDIEDERRKDAEEDILNENLYRLAIKPLNPKYQIIWDLYKKQHEAHWTAEEIDFSSDRHDYKRLDKNLQHFIKRILAFFAGADSIVNINIRKKFSKITVKEAEVAYGFQQMMENIHGEVYADMLINIIVNPVEQHELINAFKKVGSIKKMIQWAQRWIDSERRIAFSIVVFCIFEGLMFSGAFASIYWLKRVLGEDKMKGLIQSNNLIAKDEGMHTNFGCVMYNYVIHRLTQDEINMLMNEAVEICKEFTNDAIRVDMIGMNAELMHKYIEYVADRLMVYLGYDKHFNTNIPDQFQFMDTIGFLNKDNFFERRVTEYQKAYNDTNRADWAFNIKSEY